MAGRIEFPDLRDHELWAVSYTPHLFGRSWARVYKHRRNAVIAYEKAIENPKYARYTIELMRTSLDWVAQDSRGPVSPPYEVKTP